MNNLTLNKFQSIVYLKFFLIPFYHSSACWFLPSKIQLVLSSTSFPQRFSLDLLKKIFCHSEHFVAKEKDGNPLLLGLENMVGWGRTDQPKANIFSCVILAEFELALSKRSTMFLLLMSARHFLAHVAAVVSISALNVRFHFKNSIHTQHNFSSMNCQGLIFVILFFTPPNIYRYIFMKIYTYIYKCL